MQLIDLFVEWRAGLAADVAAKQGKADAIWATLTTPEKAALGVILDLRTQFRTLLGTVYGAAVPTYLAGCLDAFLVDRAVASGSLTKLKPSAAAAFDDLTAAVDALAALDRLALTH